jgi:hypothetical protein
MGPTRVSKVILGGRCLAIFHKFRFIIIINIIMIKSENSWENADKF